MLPIVFQLKEKKKTSLEIEIEIEIEIFEVLSTSYQIRTPAPTQ